ncbi:MAG: HD-GYP domain-containing protein [Lachnospiraceae bacterium]|nr:HD-GYP domain-containing protein [Lachnospiraceae bacterium]
MAKKRVRTRELEVGMIVADDIYSLNGQLILGKHSILTERLLAKLNFYSIPSISIEEIENDEPISGTLSAIVKKSEEYTKFREEFNNVVKDLDNIMGKLMVGTLTQTDLVDIVSKESELFFRKEDRFSFIDMFHNMREMSDAVLTHSLNVSIVSVMIGRWLGMSKADLEILAVGGLLHDIGKLEISEAILNKPERLTDQEYAIVKGHAIKGYQLLKNAKIDERVCEIALSHHERCDGTGYPAKLRDAQMSKYVKVVAIADVYDAMTAGRPYRDAICPFAVIKRFQDNGLQQFDTLFIMTFLNKIADTYNHSAVRLNDGREGEVIMINKNNLSRPVVRVGDTYIDLSTEKDLFVDAII